MASAAVLPNANGFISYLRVSSKSQGDSGLGLEAQRASVARFLSGGNCKLIQEVVEVESGKRNDRPKLAEALRLCRVYGCSLLVAKLDRLARNVHFISSLMESGCKFVAVDSPSANDMTIHILASVAQGEAEAISHRTRVALAALKDRGQQLGGLRSNSQGIHITGVPNSVKARQERAAKRSADLRKTIEMVIAENGSSMTLRQIAAVLNDRKIPTANTKRPGREWSAMQVQRVMKGQGNREAVKFRVKA